MRYLLPLLLLFGLCSPVVHAKSLVLRQTNGLQIYYLITKTETPRMVFQSDGTMVLNGEHYLLSDIQSFYISKTDYDGQEGTRQGASDIVQIRSDRVEMSGDVLVYDAEGRCVGRKTGNDLNLSELPAGTYLISNGKKTLKIQVQ